MLKFKQPKITETQAREIEAAARKVLLERVKKGLDVDTLALVGVSCGALALLDDRKRLLRSIKRLKAKNKQLALDASWANWD